MQKCEKMRKIFDASVTCNLQSLSLSAAAFSPTLSLSNTTTMSLLVNPHHSFSTLLSLNHSNPTPKSTKPQSFSFSPTPRRLFSIRSSSSFNDSTDPKPDPSPIADEWGEKSAPEPEPAYRFSGQDPPKNEDEWGNGSTTAVGGVPESVTEEDGVGKSWDLKRALVDTVYGSDFGFRASSEVRAEALELVSQLEAANPTPAPTESPELLSGNWILVFTAFSELLPLLAASSIPLVKVDKISQSINTSSFTIENSTTISTPVSTISFSASASFEVRSPSRIQVQFKEGKFNPPDIKSSIDLPESVNIFGQNLNLSPLQQSLNPLQNAVEGIARSISGQPPLKIPIPGERTKSWLLTTYLDKDVRISRGDGGIFVLVREGSPLLDY